MGVGNEKRTGFLNRSFEYVDRFTLHRWPSTAHHAATHRHSTAHHAAALEAAASTVAATSTAAVAASEGSETEGKGYDHVTSERKAAALCTPVTAD